MASLHCPVLVLSNSRTFWTYTKQQNSVPSKVRNPLLKLYLEGRRPDAHSAEPQNMRLRRCGLTLRARTRKVLTGMCCCFFARRCQAPAIRPHAVCRSTHVLHMYPVTACLPAQGNASLWCRYGLWVPAQQQQFQLFGQPSAHVAAADTHSSVCICVNVALLLSPRCFGNSPPPAQPD